ncbi:hypothetical protein JG687_00005655 [Phytophthora cactorum]|uniref:Uncharacterized protein n=1 Tax=Phytophthora cactorum TaxID=29920 RepID=A0A8T1ULM2_9STRA|nr:hypothetical protein JG687_00005655 [Phytophthora cactorum]
MKVFSLGLAICAALAVTTASVEAKGTICETGSGFADTGDSYSSETPVATTATVSSSSGSDATQVAASSSTAGSDADQVAGSSSTTSSSDAPVSSSTGGDVAGSDAIQQTDSSSSTGSDATQVAGSDAVQQTDSSSTAGSATTPAATSSPAGSDVNQVAASNSTAGSDATQVTSSGSNHSDDTPVTSTSSTGSDGTTASQNNGDSTTQGSEGKNDTTATPINNKGDDTTSSGSDASDVNKNSSGATPTQEETPTASSSNSKGDSSATASSSLNDSTGQTGSKLAGSGSRTLQVDVGSIDFTTTSNAEESDSTDSDDTTQYAAPTVSPASDSASGSSADSTPTQTSSDSASSQASASASSDDSPVQQTSISGSSASSNPIQQTSISASGSSDSSVSIEGSASASSADSTPTPTADSSSISSSASTSASESAASSASASASASASESSSSSSSSFSKVTRLGVRVQGDMPEWNKKHKRFVSAYYETFDEKYRAVLDTVNMASVEGALKYVQAECINASVITDCERKNNIKYVVFYQTTTVQPTAAMEYYVNATDERNFAVESCPFMAMDGGQCDPNDDGTFPDVCNQYIGAGDQPDLGFCVGGTLQDNEAIAPYPHNYWFSFPNSCPQKLWDDKTDSCRKKYAGGMCPLGVEPDGVTCTFTYEILGYILLDDVVGITSMTNPTTGKNYADYYEFCKAGGVEFSVSIVTGLVSLLTGILSSVVDLVEGLEFWANPGDSDANAERVEKLVSAYDTLVASNPTTSDGGLMRVLPTEDELAALNPSCFENSPLCAESEFGCKRSYLSQICQLSYPHQFFIAAWTSMLLLTKLQRYSRRQLAVALLGFSLFLAIIGQIQVLPVLFVLSIPVLLFFRWVFRQQQHHGVTDREIEQLFRTFLGGALIIPVLALVAQLTLGPLLASLCFFDQRSSILDQLHKYFQAPGDGRPAPVHNMKLGKMLMSLKVDKTVGYFLFLFCMAFIVAGLVEEFLKYWSGSVPAFSALKQRQQRHGALRGMMCHPSRLLFYHRPHANHAFVVFLAVVAGALGFSVMENSAYSLLAPTFRDKIETALLRSISSAPLHCICGGITGVRMAERLLAHRQGGREERGTNAAKADLGRCRTKITVILPAVLIHGTFDMQLFLLMALVTPKIEATHRTFYHVVLPTILCSIVLLASFVYLRRKLHVMENKMNETRYMHVAVDLESGQRLGAVNGGFEMEFFGNDDDDSDAEDEAFTQGENRKVRAVFDM